VPAAAVAEAGDVADEDLVRPELVPIRAAARWPRHPLAIRRLNKVAQHATSVDPTAFSERAMELMELHYAARMRRLVCAVATAIVLLVGCSHGAGTDEISNSVKQSMQDKFDTIAPRGRNAPTAGAAAPPATIGSPVRDGAFEFVVRGMKRASSITSPTWLDYMHADAQGEFIIVDLWVTNVGNQQATYMGITQKLIVGGKQYTYAGEPTFMLNDNATSAVNPGTGIDTEIAFDVPADSQPSSIELHGGLVDSPGVYVSLAQS
jgi:outer membrane murein-binding lipoprotein Lpp